MTEEHDRSAEARIRVLHVADRAAWDSFFSSEIAGNRVASVDVIDLGSARLQMILAETDGGANFPAQFHTASLELAVIVTGTGAIEVLEDGIIQEIALFAAGDVLLIPPQLVYRVRNHRASEPLLAWVFCAEDTQFYWPDGSRA
jgi:mannose-6-phosphate isomerase-like protein (cupin superfamily)